MDAMRKQLDVLMGANRNGDVTEVNRKYYDRDVCRLYLSGLCPHELFQLTVRIYIFFDTHVFFLLQLNGFILEKTLISMRERALIHKVLVLVCVLDNVKNPSLILGGRLLI